MTVSERPSGTAATKSGTWYIMSVDVGRMGCMPSNHRCHGTMFALVPTPIKAVKKTIDWNPLGKCWSEWGRASAENEPVAWNKITCGQARDRHALLARISPHTPETARA